MLHTLAQATLVLRYCLSDVLKNEPRHTDAGAHLVWATKLEAAIQELEHLPLLPTANADLKHVHIHDVESGQESASEAGDDSDVERDEPGAASELVAATNGHLWRATATQVALLPPRCRAMFLSPAFAPELGSVLANSLAKEQLHIVDFSVLHHLPDALRKVRAGNQSPWSICCCACGVLVALLFARVM